MLTADIRHAIWEAAQPSDLPTDPSTLRPSASGYTSNLAYHLPDPAQAAAQIASRLTIVPWIATATATHGYLTVTVTDDILASLAVRIARAPHPAASDTLRDLPVPAAPPADLASDWPTARARLVAAITCGLARSAGAKIGHPERLRPISPAPAPAALPIETAVAYAGRDVIIYALLTHGPRWQPASIAELPVRQHLSHPVYAVRYAHAHAASALRQAADLGLSRGEAAEFAPRLLGQPAERALLGALSWLPERVAWAARRGRPGEFARYLAELAGTYHDCWEQCPALPFGGHHAPRQEGTIRARLWLAAAAMTGIAAGLDLLGISAPARL